jgi:histidyl-tRNA synthetase
MSQTVEPKLARGLRDLLPEQMLARQEMINTIRSVYELYGFVPINTPAIEFTDVLSGSAGLEIQQSTYKVLAPEDDLLGLRFDLTVPLARVICQYKDLQRPFRRYQVSSVWRADKPGPGRFREFTQFDIDSVGVPGEVADTEIIAAICDTLKALKVGGYLVKFSSRRLLNLLLRYSEIPESRAEDVFRVLDKLDKIGLKKVRLELTEGYVDESGDPIPGLGLQNEQVDKIEEFLALSSDDRRELIDKVSNIFEGVKRSEEEIATVAKISDQLYALGYDNDQVRLDLSLARGLAYYTGPVFEAVLTDAPQFGSVFGGGRYDNLVRRFINESIPATGASIGVDRLLAALLELEKIPLRKSTAKVLITKMDNKLLDDYLQMTWELRRAGISAEFYLGSGRNIGKQLKYADKCGIPIALICGGNEKEMGVVTLKDMEVGRRLSEQIMDREEWREERPGQVEVKRENLVDGVRKMLADIEG